MKKYLLICLLILVSLSKFRNLKNLTIAGTVAPQIKFLSQNELAYQSQSTIKTLNIQTGKPTQTINLQTAATPAQLLPSQSAIIYVNKNSIYEARSVQNDRGYVIYQGPNTWIAPISSFQKTTVAAFYSSTTPKISLSIYGPSPSDNISKNITLLPSNNIRGGSSASFLGDNQVFIAGGGRCNDKTKQIDLYKISRTTNELIYKFTLDECKFSKQNQLWNLQSKVFGKVSYHLLTVIPSDEQIFVYNSQLISNSSGKYASVAHFQTQRLIGIQLTQTNTMYTVDNMLCRVLQHDIDNHQHDHYASQFQSKPLSVQVFDQKNMILAVTKLPNNTFYSAVIYNIDNDNKLQRNDIFATQGNFLKAQLYKDNYVVVYDDSNQSKLTIFIRQPQGFVPSKISNVFDISVSNNFIYVAYTNGNLNILAAYEIVDDVFVPLGDVNIETSVMKIQAIEGQNIILIPKLQGENIQVYGFTKLTRFVIVSNLPKNDTIHSSFAFAKDVLMFTSKSGDKTTFYDYKLKPLELSFNLPADSAHSIIDYRNGEVLIAVGDDIAHFVSLEYYKISNMTVTYFGTFPYLDNGKVDSSKTLLFTNKRALHVEFESATEQWSTYFELDNPPLKSYGYFYDSEYQCSDYTKATFSITPENKQMILLYSSVNGSNLERWAIQGLSLVKKQSVSVNNFKATYLDIKIASQGNLVLVNGISSVDAGRNYAVQVHNIKALSQVLSYQIISNSSNSRSFESADIVNNMFVSSYSTNNLGLIDFGISFKSITQSQSPVNTQLFKTISLIATCQTCNLIAFTGQLTTPKPNSQIIIQDYTNPSSYQQISANCKVNLLAISPTGQSLTWNCDNNKLYIYDIVQKTTTLINTKIVYQTASDLLMVSETRIIVSLDGKVTNIDLAAKENPIVSSVQSNGFSSIYATNLKKQLYAVAIDVSTIQLISFTNQIIDTIKINNSVPISSMSFNLNGDLYISNNQGFIVVLSESGCPKDQQLLNSYCQCKPLFNVKGSGCVCPYSYDSNGGNCNCDDGSYYDGENLCLDCSFLCTTCTDGGGFDCDEYSAWFYVFIILLVLIIAGAVLFISIKMKKKKRLPSLMTEEKPTPTEPFVSERENQQESKQRV